MKQTLELIVIFELSIPGIAIILVSQIGINVLFIMHRFRDMSYKEIAARLNISPKTIDYRIQKALKLLRAELKDYLPLFFLL